MNIRYELWADGRRLSTWPLQAQTPAHGDLIQLGDAVYEVIRRHWTLDSPWGVVDLRIDLQPALPRSNGPTVPPLQAETPGPAA